MIPDAPPPALRRRLAATGLVRPGVRWFRLAGGRTSRVYRACGRGRDLVCKLAVPEAASPLFNVVPAAEHAALAWLGPCGLAPRGLGGFRHGRREVLVYRHVAGTEVRAPTAALAVLLHRLHTVPAPRCPPLSRRPAFAPSLIARAIGHLQAQGWSTPLLETCAAATRQGSATAPRLCHGDPVPANVLHTSQGMMLIDWQCAHLGDPVRDLALAVSPAMHVAYGRPAPAPGAAAAFRAAYPCRATADRAARLAPAFHLQMIGHCLWRIARAPTPEAAAPDRAALAAETAALAADSVRD